MRIPAPFAHPLALLTLVLGLPLHATTAGTVSGDDALKRLQDGNTRYESARPTHPNQSAERRGSVAGGQQPFAAVLSCADSRVPIELLFDQGLGDVFVVRVAGNIAGEHEIGSLEYGAEHLGAPLLVVLGHTRCGAVTAVLTGAEAHGSIPSLVAGIAPAAEQVRAANPGTAPEKLVTETVKANVWLAIDRLLARSSILRERVKEGKLRVEGAVYELESGRVNWLGRHPEQARLLAATEGGDAAPGTHAPAAGPATEAIRDAGKPSLENASVGAPAEAAATVTELPPRTTRWILGTLVVVALLGAIAFQLTRGVLRQWPVPRRIGVGFAMILFVLGGTGLAGYEGLHSGLGNFREFRADSDHTELAARLDGEVMGMLLAAQSYRIAPRAETATRHARSHTAVLASIEHVRTLLQEPERQQLLETLRGHVNEHAALFQQLTRATGDAARTDLGHRLEMSGAAAGDEVDRLLADIAREQDADAPRIQRDLLESQTAILCIAAGALILGCLLAWLISQSIVAPLRDVAGTLGEGAAQTAAAAAQVSAAGQSLAEGASQQAASLEETGAAIEQITSMVRRNADSAARAKDLAGQTRAAADVGTADMAEMKAAMDAIKASSARVAKIVKDIDEIAFQTNILALNAAVEAARAGEAGMGFAVVADEVRSLAQRSATSAKETASRIEEAIARGEHGVQISAKVAASFGEIAGRTREVDQLVSEIAAASNEQAQGIQQVGTAISQMDKVTQGNAASAEESASAAEELNAQAEAVAEAVGHLRTLVGATDTPGHAAIPRSAGGGSHHAHTPNAPSHPTARTAPRQPRNAEPTPSSAKAPAVDLATARRRDLPMPSDTEFKDF